VATLRSVFMTETAAPRRGGRRLLGWTLGVLALLAGFVWFLPSMLSSAWMRPTVLSWVNRDPAQRVEFADLDLSWASGLKLQDVRVLDASNAPFITMKTVAIDVQWRPLLERRIVADEFTMKDVYVDLSKPAPADAKEKKPAELPEGTFGLSSVRVPVSLRDAKIHFAQGDVVIDSADLFVRVEEGSLFCDPIEAKVNGGKVTGTARVGLDGASPEHSLDLHAKGLVLDEYLAPLGARVFPLLAGDPKDGKTKGKADLDLTVKAGGRRAEELKRTLSGDGVAALEDVALESKTWLTEFLRVVGGGSDRMKLEPVRMPFHIGDGRVVLEESEARSSDVLMRLGGNVTLDGEMDCKLRVKPTANVSLVERYGRLLDPDGFVPIRLTGPVTSPTVALPGVGDILDTVLESGDLQKEAESALGRLFGEKKKGGDATAPKKPAPKPAKPKK
jgi:hypothetical protein